MMSVDTIPPEIESLIKLGPLPGDDAGVEVIEEYEKLIVSIEQPINKKEAAALCSLFGEGDFFGLAWAMVHLVESVGPEMLSEILVHAPENEWTEHLAAAIRNAEKQRVSGSG